MQGWLDEMEAEVKSQGAPGDNLEQVKKQYDNMKVGGSLSYLSRVTRKPVFKVSDQV